MLADFGETIVRSGAFEKDLHLPHSFLYALLDFIKDQLPIWRDRGDRAKVTAENELTSQLCEHLNGAARRAMGWDMLQFRTEVPDEQHKNRSIDLVPKPCNSVITIEGRCYSDFDALMPIECKRLPTPKGKGRDEREYVITREGSTGGIQRFKEGFHGASHKLGAMIAYVQDETVTFWNTKITDWIQELVQEGLPGWMDSDALQVVQEDKILKTSVLRSSHKRKRSLQDIELRHLWIEMD